MPQLMAKAHDPVLEIIRKNLRRFREEADLTVEVVAGFADLSIDSLRRWERKTQKVPIDALVKLGEIYGHSIADFHNPNPPKADLKHRPAVAYKQLPGTHISPEMHAKIQRVMEEANNESRGLKKTPKER